jgi:hypothetical protein
MTLDAAGLHKIYKQRSTSEFCDERDQSKQVLNWRGKKPAGSCPTKDYQIAEGFESQIIRLQKWFVRPVLWSKKCKSFPFLSICFHDSYSYF